MRCEIGFRWLLIVLTGGERVALAAGVLGWRTSFWNDGDFHRALARLAADGAGNQAAAIESAGRSVARGVWRMPGWRLAFLRGRLLALATIKPQLAWPLVMWLLVWSWKDWRARRRFVFGFGLVMLLLLGERNWFCRGGCRCLPRRLVNITGTRRTSRYWFGCLALSQAAFWKPQACWPVLSASGRCGENRRLNAAFGRAFALVLALTVVIVPMFAPYNQVLLAPAILALLWNESSGQPILPAIRLARASGAILLVWPWIATLGLSLAYFWLTPALRQQLWPAPFYSNFMVPVFVFGLALLNAWTSPAWSLAGERASRVVCSSAASRPREGEGALCANRFIAVEHRNRTSTCRPSEIDQRLSTNDESSSSSPPHGPDRNQSSQFWLRCVSRPGVCAGQ
jgi:hypothetical protein